MAEHIVHLNPVFLSASVPDPARDRRYFESCNSIAIRDAVIALVTVVLPHTKLVFGGHPAITPMVKWVADQLHAFDRVRMFQSKFFRDRYLKDIEVFKYEEIEAVPGDRDKSLKEMRLAMLDSERFSAGFFIGGMDGVEREYELLKEHHPEVPQFPVFTTGAAARLLWPREFEWSDQYQKRLHQAHLEQLRTKISYVALFTNILEELGEREDS